MSQSAEVSNYKFSNFDPEKKVFYLKDQSIEQSELAITSKINLTGIADGKLKTVKTNLDFLNYTCCCFINPYLNAQSDLFKINLKIDNLIKTVGYIFPASSLEDDEENIDDSFDELKQAYKFYCLKHIVSSFNWDKSFEGREVNINEILPPESCYLIIFKPQLNDDNFKLLDLKPSLALYGYYHFATGAIPTINKFLDFGSKRAELNEVIKGRFLHLRDKDALLLKKSNNILDESPLLALLYTELLVEADNPLYRFLILYQVVESLVDNFFKDQLEVLIQTRSINSNYKFVQQIHDLNNTRSTINKLFSISFDEKDEINAILRDFILQFVPDYDKNSIGDCLYDIRNLLFHDYKSIITKNKDVLLTSLVIQCEFLIHKLVISTGEKKIITTDTILSQQYKLNI